MCWLCLKFSLVKKRHFLPKDTNAFFCYNSNEIEPLTCSFLALELIREMMRTSPTFSSDRSSWGHRLFTIRGNSLLILKLKCKTSSICKRSSKCWAYHWLWLAKMCSCIYILVLNILNYVVDTCQRCAWVIFFL